MKTNRLQTVKRLWRARPLDPAVATLWVAALFLVACTATKPEAQLPASEGKAAAGEENKPSAAESAEKGLGSTLSASKLEKAATSPLADLNLVRADIPPILQAARKAPYETPSDRSCESLALLVKALDGALGADLDTASTSANPGLVERGASEAGNAAVGVVRSAAEGLVPYRSWVRKLTGAERYSREVAAAIAAGTIRRAYLKGLGVAAGCTPPAAPLAAHP